MATTPNGTPAPLPTPRPDNIGSTQTPTPPPRPANLDAPEVSTSTDAKNGDSAAQSNTQAGAPHVNQVSNGDLPWAVVLMPTTSSGVGGVGEGRHKLQTGDWVFGFFADGDSCQQPVIVGVIPGGAGGGSGSFGGSGTGTSGDVNNDGSIPAAANIPQTEAQKIVYQKLRAIGYNHVQTVGIMGNLQAESAFKATAHGDKNLKDNAYGIAQWRGPRWRNMQNFAKAKGKSPFDLETQVEFIKHEIEKYPDHALNTGARLNNARTPEEAARAFVTYERPAGYSHKLPDPSSKVHDMSKRIANAKAFDKRFAGQQTPSSIPTPRAGGPR